MAAFVCVFSSLQQISFVLSDFNTTSNSTELIYTNNDDVIIYHIQTVRTIPVTLYKSLSHRGCVLRHLLRLWNVQNVHAVVSYSCTVELPRTTFDGTYFDHAQSTRRDSVFWWAGCKNELGSLWQQATYHAAPLELYWCSQLTHIITVKTQY